MKKLELRCREGYAEIIEVEQMYGGIDDNTDIMVNGSVTVKAGYDKKYKTVSIYVNLCTKDGKILFIINSFKTVALETNSYFSFSATCSSVKRFCNVNEVEYAEIYPIFNEKDF